MKAKRGRPPLSDEVKAQRAAKKEEEKAAKKAVREAKKAEREAKKAERKIKKHISIKKGHKKAKRTLKKKRIIIIEKPKESSKSPKKAVSAVVKSPKHERRFVIQEHDAKRAGIHWDLRFEDAGDIKEYQDMRTKTREPCGVLGDKVLRSFAVPKAGINHRMPKVGERWLAIQTEDHPWEYQHFHGHIKSGYGEGSVKLLFNDIISTPVFSENKIKFVYKDKPYVIFKVHIRGKPHYMLTQTKPK